MRRKPVLTNDSLSRLHQIEKVIAKWAHGGYFYIQIHAKDCEACEEGIPVAEWDDADA